MELEDATTRLSALGHPGRLAVFRLLARRAPGAVRPTEIAQALGLKPNTLSVYVGALERAGLITSERRGREIHYRIARDEMGALIDFLVADCCRGRPDLCAPLTAKALADPEGTDLMPDRVYNVLFICTGNSARSQISETLMNDLGEGRFKGFSAGTHPGGQVHPLAEAVLNRNGHRTDQLTPKSLNDMQGSDVPAFDFVFTVCDQAANEECPVWPGHPMTAHWGVPDPAKEQGGEAERAYAFAQTYAQMRRRIQALAALPVETLDRISLQTKLDEIAQIEEPETA